MEIRLFNKLILLIFLQSLYFTGIAGDTTTIVIVHVNDIHGRIEQFGKLAAFVNGIKSKNENTFLVSAGDMFTGNPVVDRYPDKGFPIINLMNNLGFSIAELGNHEFDYGQEILKKRFIQATFPIICSNIISDKSPIGQTKQYYTIKTNNGIKLAFIGYLQVNEKGIPDTHPDRIKNIEFIPFTNLVEKQRHLKDSANILIALSHLGIENDKVLATKFPELEIIIGAHSHTFIPNPVNKIGKPMIVQCGSYLEYIGKLTIKYADGKVVFRADTLIQTSSLKDIDTVIQKIADAYDSEPFLQEQIGFCKTAIVGKQDIGSLMADAAKSLPGVDFAFQNNGGIRLDSIPSGAIIRKTIYNLDPFDNEIIMFKMTDDEIISLIKNSYTKSNNIDLQVAGLHYKITLNADSTIKNITLKNINGAALLHTKKYIVTMNSYIASTYKFDHFDTGIPMRIGSAENLLNFIRKQKKIYYKNEVRAIIK